MNSQHKEILDITQEECAEVVVAISKISRFGADNYKPGKPLTNRQHLAVELGDLQAMIDLCHEFGIVSFDDVTKAKAAKLEKLRHWSSIFNSDVTDK